MSDSEPTPASVEQLLEQLGEFIAAIGRYCFSGKAYLTVEEAACYAGISILHGHPNSAAVPAQ